MNSSEFAHCNNSETCLSLHDCIADRVYFRDGIFGFEFKDGFWITPEHPDSNLSETVRTDFSKVEYVSEYGNDDDIQVHVFEKSLFGNVIRNEWTVNKLIDRINSGKYKLEFTYQYIGYNTRIVECWLHFDKKPYHKECVMKISASAVNYYRNNLQEDCPW